MQTRCTNTVSVIYCAHQRHTTGHGFETRLGDKLIFVVVIELSDIGDHVGK